MAKLVFFLLVVLTHRLLLCTIVIGSVTEQVNQEEFTEELLLKPLPDRKVLAHFHFQNTAPTSSTNGRHHHLFPKAISQLVQKFQVKEMELSFTQGRWNYEHWGGFDPISSSNAKPPGVELWAVFDVHEHQIDASWKNLTHALSGLFCASINFLESSTTYSSPEWGFPLASSNLRYGTLPREAVCTENLTPWLKLLPCRDKSGISALMDRPSIYRGFYHSQRLRLISTGSNLDATAGITLEQTLTIVLQPNNRRTSVLHSGKTHIQPSWSISSIFGRKVSERCFLAKSSNVYLQFDRGLATEVKNLQKGNKMSGANDVDSENFRKSSDFELSINPDRVFEEVNGLHSEYSSVLYKFNMEKYNKSEPFDLSFVWKVPVVWACQQAPLHATRFLMGSGNERGVIAISLKSTEMTKGLLGANAIDDRCKVQVDVFQVVPWYIKVYYHSLQIFVDKQPKATAGVVEKINVSPSKDKVSPGVMELVLKLPCCLKSATLSIDFDKGFLHIDEYPPDANQGFDIPSAVISFPNFNASMAFPKGDSLNESPMMSKFQENNPVMAYTEVLLVPLTTPDFSMPYNVITITCTVFALYFGSLLNVLRRRVAEEERLLVSKAPERSGQLPPFLSKLYAKLRGKPWESPSSTSPPNSSSIISSKLMLTVILVAVIAVVLQQYFSCSLSQDCVWMKSLKF